MAIYRSPKRHYSRVIAASRVSESTPWNPGPAMKLPDYMRHTAVRFVGRIIGFDNETITLREMRDGRELNIVSLPYGVVHGLSRDEMQLDAVVSFGVTEDYARRHGVGIYDERRRGRAFVCDYGEL